MPKKYRKRRLVKKYKRKTKTKINWNIPNAGRTYMMICGCTQYPSAGTGAGQGYTFPLNLPTMIRNNAGNLVQMGGVPTAVLDAIALFDTYKVLGLKVSLLPNAVNTYIPTTDTPNEIYLQHDPDDSINLNSDQKALSLGSFPQTYAPGKRITYEIKQRKNMPWINTVNIANAVAGLLSQTTTTTAQTNLTPTFFESVKIWLPNVANTDIIGRFVVQWMIMFKGITAA